MATSNTTNNQQQQNSSQDPFASTGGGVQYNGGWIPAAMAQQWGVAPGQGQSTTQQTSSTTSETTPRDPNSNVNVPGVGTIANGELTSTDFNSNPNDLSTSQQQALEASLPTYSAVSNPGTPTIANATYSQSPQMQSLIEQLMGQAGESKVVNPNDPVIKTQTDAYQAQQERAARNAINDSAEQNSPYNTGQQANQARMIQEQEGQNVGQFEGQLMQNELSARRTEIQNALQGLSGVLSQDQQNALQTELANLNSQLSQAGMGVQNQQYYQSLNTQQKQFVDQLTQAAAQNASQTKLSNYTLAQQQSQYAGSLAQQGQFQQLQKMFQDAQLSQQQQQFLMSLAQQGKIADMQNAFQYSQLGQNESQFNASLAQQNELARMQNALAYAELGQNQGQFLDTLGNNVGLEQELLNRQSQNNG